MPQQDTISVLELFRPPHPPPQKKPKKQNEQNLTAVGNNTPEIQLHQQPPFHFKVNY